MIDDMLPADATKERMEMIRRREAKIEVSRPVSTVALSRLTITTTVAMLNHLPVQQVDTVCPVN